MADWHVSKGSSRDDEDQAVGGARHRRTGRHRASLLASALAVGALCSIPLVATAADAPGAAVELGLVPPAPVSQGEPVTTVLRLRNTGSSDLGEGLRLTARLGEGLVLESLPARLERQCSVTVDRRGIDCVLAEERIVAGGALEYRLVARLLALPDAAPEAVTVVAALDMAEGAEADGDESDNTATATVELAAGVELGDRVWLDENHDGLQDATEPGLGSISVRLLDDEEQEIPVGPDGRLGTGDDALGGVVTDVDGFYRFSNLPPRHGYALAFGNIPDGLGITFPDAAAEDVDSDADPFFRIWEDVPNPGLVNLNLDMGLQTSGIGDRVWHDADGNGRQDAGEAGIPGIEVNLLAGGAQVATTVTDDVGRYAFSDLPLGEYVVEVVVPAAWELSPARVEGVGERLDSDVVAVPGEPTRGRTPPIFVEPGRFQSMWDAGFAVAPGSIGDRVWDDADGDGRQEPGEIALEGVSLALYDLAGETVSGPGGGYRFDVDAGTYQMRVMAPDGWGYSPQRAADATVDSDVGPDGWIDEIVVRPGVHRDDVDAGLAKLATVGGFVWNDRDRDGRRDAGEPPLPGVGVELRSAPGSVLARVVSGPDGTYRFSQLVGSGPVTAGDAEITISAFSQATPGRYQIGFIRPLGWLFSPPGVGSDEADSDVDPNTGEVAPFRLGVGEVNLTYSAGVHQPPATIGGHAWQDLDGDGLRADSEPHQPGLTVRVTDTDDDVVATTVTDREGAWRVEGLQPVAGYRVAFGQLPAGYSVTRPHVGNDERVDSDVDPATMMTASLAVAPAEVRTTVDIGLVPPPPAPPTPPTAAPTSTTALPAPPPSRAPSVPSPSPVPRESPGALPRTGFVLARMIGAGFALVLAGSVIASIPVARARRTRRSAGVEDR